MPDGATRDDGGTPEIPTTSAPTPTSTEDPEPVVHPDQGSGVPHGSDINIPRPQTLGKDPTTHPMESANQPRPAAAPADPSAASPTRAPLSENPAGYQTRSKGPAPKPTPPRDRPAPAAGNSDGHKQNAIDIAGTANKQKARIAALEKRLAWAESQLDEEECQKAAAEKASLIIERNALSDEVRRKQEDAERAAAEKESVNDCLEQWKNESLQAKSQLVQEQTKHAAEADQLREHAKATTIAGNKASAEATATSEWKH